MGDREREVVDEIEATLSAGDTAPDWVRPCNGGALDCVLAVDGRALGGRIECFFVSKPAAGRGRLAMASIDRR